MFQNDRAADLDRLPVQEQGVWHCLLRFQLKFQVVGPSSGLLFDLGLTSLIKQIKLLIHSLVSQPTILWFEISIVRNHCQINFFNHRNYLCQ